MYIYKPLNYLLNSAQAWQRNKNTTEQCESLKLNVVCTYVLTTGLA